ncbi:MAG TPA: aldehyde dehydrogenase family protein, partial [Ferruginibacter sp.]|nr:aldehyde dehydrogenase family protein [Ferruginibacter sp.]
KRIAVSKFSNAGQLCVAPDFVLVQTSVKEAFVAELKKQLVNFFGPDAQQSASYGRIINDRQFNRLLRYLQEGTMVLGGKSDAADRYIEPTILYPTSMDTAVMNDEIFGPILPIVSFEQKEEALAIIRRHRDPLAAYVFSRSNQRAADWLASMPSGGACINNAAWQVTNGYLPFGGRGNSGIGAYHGKAGFEVFSHLKAVLRTPTWFDPSIKYPPLNGRLSLFKKFIG